MSSVQAPSDALSGTAVNVTWTVANNGSGPAGPDWIDRIYLSTDASLSAGGRAAW